MESSFFPSEGAGAVKPLKLSLKSWGEKDRRERDVSDVAGDFASRDVAPPPVASPRCRGKRVRLLHRWVRCKIR